MRTRYSIYRSCMLFLEIYPKCAQMSMTENMHMLSGGGSGSHFVDYRCQCCDESAILPPRRVEPSLT